MKKIIKNLTTNDASTDDKMTPILPTIIKIECFKIVSKKSIFETEDNLETSDYGVTSNYQLLVNNFSLSIVFCQDT